MKNKICIYGICKNELGFIDQFLESAQEADYICLLDTGSTDGTYEKLLNDSRVTKVEQQLISPWRFDVARNLSMRLIPEDADICVSVDLDERFDPGWADVLRNTWNPEIHYMAYYRYAWSHDDQGIPIKVFTYNKIHTKEGWTWVYPVHEVLLPVGAPLDPEKILNLEDQNVYLHHYQDTTKPRSSYLPLLEIRATENPNDLETEIHLVHEYLYNSIFDKCIQLVDNILQKYQDLPPDLITSLLLFKGDGECALKLYDEAIISYDKAIQYEPSFAEPYVAKAQVYFLQNLYEAAIPIYKEALNNSTRYFTWFRRDVSYSDDQIYNDLACCYACIGDFENAFVNIHKALFLNKSVDKYFKNLTFIEEHLFDNMYMRANNSFGIR